LFCCHLKKNFALGLKWLEKQAFSCYNQADMLLTGPAKYTGFFSKIWFLWGLCLLINIITFLLIFFKISPSGKTLALHYNVLVGVEWYGKGQNLYLIPLVGFLISAVNFILYRTLKDTGSLLSFLTGFISLCVQVILMIAVLFLSTIN